ncbi:HSP20-like chaperone [Aspergillus heteromorphus CBS 117.55]|uniref:HSP20-like chaperone n=1 Tax=Aspergillus heteromorphus CBS 117.55 TaxID=1448321 RepID=A0A317WM54_9EURO|nr:HSP20-like chaperone [Aspergillus heteromorphus CBS 117.55]PWY87429.1 HSP20-like chaperone [Aspergillus heteromorphus CBS 117.55]
MERAPIGTPLPLRPAFDIRLQPDGYHIHGEVPGVTPQQLRLTFIDRRTLMIYGDFHREYDNPPEDFRPDCEGPGCETGDTAKWLLAERETGYFSRMFVLQKPIRKEGTQAALQNGILSVFLPLDPGPGNINSL